MNFFVFDNAENTLRIDDYNILLVKEFKELWDVDFNKCKEDKTGKLRLKAFKYFTYIFLMLDFKSPYFSYLEHQKHEAALSDSELTESDLEEIRFVNAYRKYDEIQSSDPILSLINSARRTLYKLQVFYDNIDFNEDVDAEGRPLYKPKDIIEGIAGIAKMRNQLNELEIEHKKGLAASGKKVRGDVEVAYDEG